jgi:hypothetical protein
LKNNPLAEFARSNGYVPLAWAGSTTQMDYLNIGDALSPVMVALLSGMDVRRVPFQSQSIRMACVGTIGHGLSGGQVFFWGTGASTWSNPSAPPDMRKIFEISADSRFTVAATRGPFSENILTGGQRGSIGVYGDPVWLLPRFYRPEIKKRWKLGVIVHLSELCDRETEAHVLDSLVRYRIPEELRGDITLINTVSPIGASHIREKLDQILACERIVSTSLHGMVFAESYGIPCLHFPTGGGVCGLGSRSLLGAEALDTRVVDLYSGLGLSELDVYTQPHGEPTDWTDLMASIDARWHPKQLDEQALIQAFPLDYKPLCALDGQTIWDHPTIAGIQFQHAVTELRRSDSDQRKMHGKTANVPSTSALSRNSKVGLGGAVRRLARGVKSLIKG